ncbi:MAG: tRNA threonylcarbamoyladenosine dehydratase [Erysipelotrichia bacterium]|nr:tRNA threonylcarbamoyladenosine dehydratase [Erysipelotrichia bacterium]
MNEIYTRVINLIGTDKWQKLQKKTVLVAGLGGVGGYALEALVRSGIGRFIIVDKDTVDITNLNRQIIATQDTIGKNKTDTFEERIYRINPQIQVIKVTEFLNEDNLQEIFSYGVDFVIDAIDTMTSKISLWKYCQEQQIDFIASLGMARRLDPTKLKITTLKKTENDPMAKALRSLARKNELSLDIPVVFSAEKPLEESKSLKSNLGSMMFVPASAGIMAAYYVVSYLIDKD